MIDFEAHKKFGESIKEFREKLIKESVKEKSYKETHKQKALKLLDELNFVLDDIACRDFKEESDKDVLGVYYEKDN